MSVQPLKKPSDGYFTLKKHSAVYMCPVQFFTLLKSRSTPVVTNGMGAGGKLAQNTQFCYPIHSYNCTYMIRVVYVEMGCEN